MPELPEVETVRRGLAAQISGRRIQGVELRRTGLRRPFPPDFVLSLQGAHILSVGRRAKYLLFDLDRPFRLLAHLGMSGRFSLYQDQLEQATPAPGFDQSAALYFARPPDPIHDHVVLSLEGLAQAPALRLVYNDPRRFGVLDLAPLTDALCPHLTGLGPEPLAPDFDGARLGVRLTGRKSPLKTALLDQNVVAGLGNIYVCEALFRAGLSPYAPAGSLSARELDGLAAVIKAVLSEAIAAGGSTLKDYAGADGAPGGFQDRFAVYDRAGDACLRQGCEGIVTRAMQAGRASFFCPICQT